MAIQIVPAPTASRPRRGFGNVVIVLVVLALLATVAGLLVVRGGAGDASSSIGVGETYEAREGSFAITVPASGELAARSQVEISSTLEVRAVITSIVDEGTFVRKGDVLIELDDEDIRNRIREAELSFENASASLASAESNREVKKLTGESSIRLAEVDIRLAETALESWREGEDKSRQQDLELEVTTAEKDYARLAERFEASKNLLEKEFISEDEFKRDEIDLLRANSRLSQSRLGLETYTKYDRMMQLERLQADIQRFADKKLETQERHTSEMEAANRDVQSKTFTLETRREELAKAKAQLEQCVITAPQDGLVVYSASLQSNWRNREDPPTVGTELRRNRTVIVLPDTSQMVAEVKVNEALAGRIRPGQTAVVVSDALTNVPINGTVIGVGVLAEGGGWRDPNRRDYTVRVALDAGEDLGLKPSMRCKATINVGAVEDALNVPIQAVARDGRLAYVWVASTGGVEARRVQLGRASELSIEIRDGLEPGEEVLLRDPRPEEVALSVDDLKTALAEAGVGQGGRPSGGPPAGVRTSEASGTDAAPKATGKPADATAKTAPAAATIAG
ncbi:MAG: efflux RND transporter periplasmic adaptor subunit [Phycisphaerales bacterium]